MSKTNTPKKFNDENNWSPEKDSNVISPKKEIILDLLIDHKGGATPKKYLSNNDKTEKKQMYEENYEIVDTTFVNKKSGTENLKNMNEKTPKKKGKGKDLTEKYLIGGKKKNTSKKFFEFN